MISKSKAVLFFLKLHILHIYQIYFLLDGFRMDDIRYKWAHGLNSSLDVSPTIELPQLKYKDYKLVERQFRLSTGFFK